MAARSGSCARRLLSRPINVSPRSAELAARASAKPAAWRVALPSASVIRAPHLGGDRGKINASASECHAAGFSNVRSKLSSQLSAGANLLNGLFSEFDRLALG